MRSAYPRPAFLMTFVSPWYQIAPRMANGWIGWIMPLYSPATFGSEPDTSHSSIAVPPQQLSMSPTGTLRSLCSRWP